MTLRNALVALDRKGGANSWGWMPCDIRTQLEAQGGHDDVDGEDVAETLRAGQGKGVFYTFDPLGQRKWTVTAYGKTNKWQ